MKSDNHATSFRFRQGDVLLLAGLIAAGVLMSGCSGKEAAVVEDAQRAEQQQYANRIKAIENNASMSAEARKRAIDIIKSQQQSTSKAQ